MDQQDILNTLNDRQAEAVSAPFGNLLVLAGAGSGKTRVLVHRIGWLIEMEGLSPANILAVTFTNKAAQEMRGRVEHLLGYSASHMWMGTFHGLAHRLLRAHWEEAQLSQNFQILDADDQFRLVRRVLKQMNLDEDQWPPREIQWFINAKKDEGLRPHQVTHHKDFHSETLARIYQEYERACALAGVVDFAELLLRSYELWSSHPDILQHYQQRFRAVLVDEFQDTNAVQYRWLRLLATPSNIIMAVGDDDQSIYGWRGARIENIHKIQKDYPRVQVIRLEQNYRSTGCILEAANALIAHNETRMGKKLWTEDHSGELISLYEAFNEIDEARYIIDRIKHALTQGLNKSEIAILYRSNAQSRILEEALIQANIPYRIYGGQRFFERMEIKDALAYLRLVVNRHDDASFERVINTPTRGIGHATLENLRQFARAENISLWQAAETLIRENHLNTRAANALQAFLQLIDQTDEKTKQDELGDMMEYILSASGLMGHYRKEKGEKAQSRIENLEELVTAIRQFKPEEGTGDMPLVQAFLAHASLEAGERQSDRHEDSIQLMTLHSAKGLEFSVVFLVGMEEGLFPHQLSSDDPDRLEEERRLCYVGITRAMKKLFLTYAEIRRIHGSEVRHRPSRFIKELPTHVLEEVRFNAKIARPLSSQHYSPYRSGYAQPLVTPLPHGMQVGSRVRHKTFGEGIIIGSQGQGERAQIQVKFAKEGTKWLMAPFLEPTE